MVSELLRSWPVGPPASAATTLPDARLERAPACHAPMAHGPFFPSRRALVARGGFLTVGRPVARGGASPRPWPVACRGSVAAPRRRPPSRPHGRASAPPFFVVAAARNCCSRPWSSPHLQQPPLEQPAPAAAAPGAARNCSSRPWSSPHLHRPPLEQPAPATHPVPPPPPVHSVVLGVWGAEHGGGGCGGGGYVFLPLLLLLPCLPLLQLSLRGVGVWEPRV
ncbi:unnamed protein product [Closterium sp. NIES-54]